jgi:hypothetical protein
MSKITLITSRKGVTGITPIYSKRSDCKSRYTPTLTHNVTPKILESNILKIFKSRKLDCFSL